ncbi:phosphatase PAP2 family protein [Urbifossiella limnaea]|uniref:FG-GAP repeat protein n=1 Tax=Urbifossiella limnaea TaxID=2528023 RepID=A0A517XZN7_9BACT|nr:phosphatase PAP2 family protein [Urbifossiella limnaea]QDU22969.1 FG-GAP repeat protein [Urbifossiella limnaea]
MRHHRNRFALERLEPRDVPAAQFAAVGSDAGDIGRAQLVDTETGTPRYSVFPFGTDFTGGVSVAAGDVNGDGVTDLIAAPGAGGGPVVKVFDGVTGVELYNQLVFDASFRGGVYVAAGDTNLDGKAEIIAGAGEGGGPAVTVIDGGTGAVASSFFAYGDGFRGGVRVAAGDVDGDGRADVIAGAGPGGAPHVRAVSVAAGGRELASFLAYDAAFAGGVFVAAGDLDADGRTDIVTGTGAGGGPLVNSFRGDGTAFDSFVIGDGSSRAGVRVGVVHRGYTADIATVVPGAGVGRFTPTGEPTDASGLTGNGWVSGPAEATPDAALLWNQVALRAVAADATPAPAAARALAMLHIAVFESANVIVRRYESYSFTPGSPDDADPEAAALLAGEQVLSGLFPEQATEFVRIRNARLALIPDGTAKDGGLQTGAQEAEFLLFIRGFDGSAEAGSVPFTPGTNPGDWRPTPPDNAPFLLPGWGNVSTFAIGSAAVFRPNGPPEVSSLEYAAELNAVQQLGRIDSSTRTADQTQQALFWAGGAGASAVTQDVVRRENLDLLDSARAFALVAMAAADAAIVAWDSKLTFARWRPITAVREAGGDDNPGTTADPTWTPLLATPNHPDYISDTAAVTAAGAAVLTALFGEGYAFRAYSPALPGVTRSFAGFADAAAEAAQSGVSGGVQFPSSAADGLAAGEAVGGVVVGTKLRPLA